MGVSLSFCGAAGTVTGSCFWVRTDRCQFLVDCGMFQGSKTIRELNYGPFPFDPRKLDFVLLTHAHIDHSGLLPKLVKRGFSGPIVATEPTADLLGFMLPDSGHIQEMDVRRLNRRNSRRGMATVQPIYTRNDAEQCLEQLKPVDYEDWIEAGDGVRVRYWNAGHILGSSSIEVEIATGNADNRLLRILFSGDIGPEHKLFHPSPEGPDNLDYVVCESTYGGRARPHVTEAERRDLLVREVGAALKRGGNLLIPAFAVERTQELLLDLSIAIDEGRLPAMPIFIDSPLAIRATGVFAKHAEIGSEALTRRNLHVAESRQESQAIGNIKSGAIILSASGMCDAGRIRHHLSDHLWRAESTVLFVGYQAAGTLGSLLTNGAEKVRIHGEEIRVRAAIRQIHTYSGHADGEELLVWLKERLPVKRAAFLVHGETEGLNSMRDGLVALGVEEERVVVPQLDDTMDLLGDGRLNTRGLPKRLPPDALTGLDWHNEFARFSLDLRHLLQETKSDKERKLVLNSLRRALRRT